MNMYNLFIDGAKLPNTLTKTQLYEFLAKAEQGDEEAIKIVAEHNLRLVLYRVTNKFKYVSYDKRDLFSVGNIGLMKAIRTFDKSKNIEFVTYAAKCIDNEILMFLRKLKKEQNVVSLDEAVASDKDGKELKVEAIISSGIDIIGDYERDIICGIIREIVDELPDRDREMTKLYFGFYNNKRYTQREIASLMFISQGHVSRTISKIVKKIGKRLQEMGIIELNSKNNQKRKRRVRAK